MQTAPLQKSKATCSPVLATPWPKSKRQRRWRTVDYLAFGVWLIEDGDEDTGGDQPSFAAFANGGERIENFATYVTLTGTANYSGKAAGVHTEGDSVDWFEGDASLTANFGAIDTDVERTAEADSTVGTDQRHDQQHHGRGC